ncbi:23S rRNA (pseudouridine(1915)-N(3))-methyltransferase RlmH [Candidatus Palauibacter polyketidifaciens]|uniref:23S rRNA (pseudouridine(1915)-N(3))-methyltransferase RlmH n=1 Tax=Candidatus Palauibacter polyketidifaciens TaxID=3056740 RepID=UPI0023854678|nr:23S rRNA (pseudouridine(1915)-N(3))-methyltransferase RlmH [Candidatus Palauibacter polyketidifaciens]MDE2721357.1 23S rRNA (pseudouridine(1915)-N(3))-methyltransferase RlmH [Candidatus Palauibacter polyketidifaciens]
MTRIVVASVARNRATALRRATEEYENRLRRYVRFEAIAVDPARLPDARAGEAREQEAAALERRLPDELDLIALTREGERWTTRALADYLDDMRTYGRPGAAFAIGGAHGLASGLLARARTRLALSAMTLPHEVARLVLTEQLYRAATILRGEPYHKGP